jgi:Arc/MetJ-type ribon-helix-helix transcriptional regulator
MCQAIRFLLYPIPEDGFMGVIQVHLPEELVTLIDRQVAEGRVASESAFFLEAARRFVEDLAVEDEIVSEAHAGIEDAEAGRFVTVASLEDNENLHERTMERLRNRLAASSSREPGSLNPAI